MVLGREARLRCAGHPASRLAEKATSGREDACHKVELPLYLLYHRHVVVVIAQYFAEHLSHGVDVIYDNNLGRQSAPEAQNEISGISAEIRDFCCQVGLNLAKGHGALLWEPIISENHASGYPAAPTGGSGLRAWRRRRE